MKFDISRVAWPDQYRNSNRRKEVRCALCEKEMTKRNSGVCHACTRAYNVGIAYQKYIKDSEAGEEVVLAKMPSHPSIDGSYALSREEIEARYYPGERFYFAASELSKRLLELSGITPAAKNYPTISMLYPEGDVHDYRDDSYYLGSRSTFDLINRVFVLVRYVQADAYRKGYQEGQSVLTQLASGQMTVEQLNAFETKKKVK